MSESVSSQEDNNKAPEKLVEDALWQLGMEHPECRVVIANLTKVLRGRAIEAMKGEKMSQSQKRDIKEALGRNFQMLRRRANITQKQLAEELGVRVQVVSQWETGDRMLTVKHRERCASLLGVSIEELTTIEAEPSE